jgi:hypothetical protein
MKKLFVLVFVLTLVSWSYAQKSVDFVIKNSTGKLFNESNGVYTLTFLKVVGLKSTTDFDAFKKLVTSQAIVKKFDYVAEAESDGARKATLELKSSEKDTIIDFFKAINVKHFVVNDKSFTLDQSEQLKNYLKELKEKAKQQKSSGEKRVSGQPVE